MAPGNRNKPRRAAGSESTYTIMDLARDFPDDATCLDYLWRRHYSPDGERAMCPKCEQTRKFHRVASRPSYSCDTCGHHIHPTAHTIMHKSSTSLQLWFHAIFLMAQTRCGISAKQLERDLGVTYKCAWRMFTKIRNELMTQDDGTPLTGAVEMDEMYVGGKPRLADKARFRASENTRSAALKWSDQTKTQVFGAVERGGRVTAHVIPNRRKPELMARVRQLVGPNATVYTDSAHAYDRLRQPHHTVNHHAQVYVAGDVHTQTIDGFWSLVKTGII